MIWSPFIKSEGFIIYREMTLQYLSSNLFLPLIPIWFMVYNTAHSPPPFGCLLGISNLFLLSIVCVTINNQTESHFLQNSVSTVMPFIELLEPKA